MSKILPSVTRTTLHCGGFQHVGGRNYQEDYIVCVNDLNKFIPKYDTLDDSSRRSFYAVFDGHGGDMCSQFLSQHFHVDLATHPKFVREPITALNETWKELEKKFLTHCQNAVKHSDNMPHPLDGSTATVALIINEDAYITNCGDSACFVMDSSGTAARVTEIHSTDNTEEVERCREAGSRVISMRHPLRGIRGLCCCTRQGKLRIQPGGLLVTRSFGDAYAKNPLFGGIKGSVINDHGAIAYRRLTEGVKYIVLGSDGMWDPLSPSEVFGIINGVLDNTQAITPRWTPHQPSLS